jgi:hypothetical protein
MPKYEKIRNKQDLRRRISDGSKKSRFIAVINSGFFLWLLTAICLTIGGSIFAERQKCVADSRALIDRFNALDEELVFRDLYVSSKIRSAKTIEDLTKTTLTHPVRHSDLKVLSSDELVSEETNIFRRSNPDELARLKARISVVRPATHAQDIFDSLPFGRMTISEAVAALDKYPSRSSEIRLGPDCALNSVSSRLITGMDYILWPMVTTDNR